MHVLQVQHQGLAQALGQDEGLEGVQHVFVTGLRVEGGVERILPKETHQGAEDGLGALQLLPERRIRRGVQQLAELVTEDPLVVGRRLRRRLAEVVLQPVAEGVQRLAHDVVGLAQAPARHQFDGRGHGGGQMLGLEIMDQAALADAGLAPHHQDAGEALLCLRTENRPHELFQNGQLLFPPHHLALVEVEHVRQLVSQQGVDSLLLLEALERQMSLRRHLELMLGPDAHRLVHPDAFPRR